MNDFSDLFKPSSANVGFMVGFEYNMQCKRPLLTVHFYSAVNYMYLNW